MTQPSAVACTKGVLSEMGHCLGTLMAWSLFESANCGFKHNQYARKREIVVASSKRHVVVTRGRCLRSQSCTAQGRMLTVVYRIGLGGPYSLAIRLFVSALGHTGSRIFLRC
jgi:hypothetical protein